MYGGTNPLSMLASHECTMAPHLTRLTDMFTEVKPIEIAMVDVHLGGLGEWQTPRQWRAAYYSAIVSERV